MYVYVQILSHFHTFKPEREKSFSFSFFLQWYMIRSVLLVRIRFSLHTDYRQYSDISCHIFIFGDLSLSILAHQVREKCTITSQFV